MADKKLLTAHEVAEVLDLSVDTIWRYTREKRIPHIEVGPRQYRYSHADVLQALNKNDSGLVQEEKPDYNVSGKLTHEDYAKITGKVGYTIQLIDGLIVSDPAPTFVHQRISRRLLIIIDTYFAKVDPTGEVFSAPIEVQLGEHTVVQPDLLYLPSSRPARSNPINSLPELIIEISPSSTGRTDRIRKHNSYQKAGVPHYINWSANYNGTSSVFRTCKLPLYSSMS